MKSDLFKILVAVALAFSSGASITQAAAPSSPQGLITGKAFYGISGTATTALTGSPKFPNNPDELFFFPYFEWAATGDIFTPPGNFSDNYGGQIVGYFYPPATGDYVFYLSADDNAALYLSTDETAANKKLIARESAWSNPRQYFESGGNSDLTMKDSSQFTGTEWATKDPGTGGAKITLQANRPYYIEAIFKEGGGGDNLSVAVLDPNFTIDSSLPIPGDRLSSDRTNGPVTITSQPQSQTVDERGTVTFSVNVDGTPPYTFQWKKNGADIPDATGMNFTVTSATVADNNAKFSVVVTGAQGTATSQDATLTVTPDTTLPTILSAKGSANLTEVVLTFSEKLDPASAAAAANYQISSASGPLNVTGAALSESGTQVTLTTAQQTLGTKYTILVSNVKDTAATANTIAASSKKVFFPTGKLVEENGFIVFEAENFDRNSDGLWIKDTTRGTPSAGASVVLPNGAGGNESSKLEYDVEFKQAATYVIWYRASGNDGSDDSAWFHLDGERPIERANANDAAMTGFSGQMDFVWRSDSFDGPDPMSVDIAAPGTYAVGLARREDGSFFDKFILTTDSSFSPTGFGPPETRQGAPALPTVSLTAPTAGQTFAAGGNVALTATGAGDMGLEIERVEFTANGEVIGEATSSPFTFTWSNAPSGIFAIRATAIDEIGGQTTSDSTVITVGTPPPQALLVVGTDSDPTLNPSDDGVKSRLESQGWQVTVVQAPPSTTADADGKQLIIVSSTVNSGDVGTKFRDVQVPVINWEQATQDDFLMTLNTDGTDRGTLADQTQIDITNATHPLAAGLSAGTITATTELQAYSWGLPNQTATIVATIAGDPARAVIYGYDTGAMLADGTTPAPARRVMFLWGNNGLAASTPDVLKLFDAAVQWASGVTPGAGGDAPKIAWVSFHPGDDQPSAAAATAGFTQAADVGYTDLLEANGYDVTRFVTSGTPDAALLNAHDLVIISRSVPSGDYQDPPETAAWNGITAPTMILGGYVIRDNRLNFMTGNTIPDTAGPVKLTVNNPAHPIFEGVALDAQNTMVNDYAGIESFNGTVQRGISVVTDAPREGGTVLATIGTAADPAFGGMVIGEWPSGATVDTDTLGGKRLVFLTGSRENDGLTSQGAGIYDLEADGAKLFLNAVKYLAGSGAPPNGGGSEVAIARSANGVTITWTGAGTLESAPAVTGPWTAVANATSPHAVQTTGTAQFFRVRE